MFPLRRKVLKAQPKDPIKFAAEYFTQKRATSLEEVLRDLEEEKEKLKRFRYVAPWKYDTSDSCLTRGFQEVNEVKSLSIGPLADNFEFTPPPTPPPEE